MDALVGNDGIGKIDLEKLNYGFQILASGGWQRWNVLLTFTAVPDNPIEATGLSLQIEAKLMELVPDHLLFAVVVHRHCSGSFAPL
jgi:hypothetical protein